MFKFISSLFLGLFWVSKTSLAVDIAVPKEEAIIWANQKGHELIYALGMSDIVEKYAILDKMLTEDVNLNYISKFVIGKYGKKMNKEQTRRYNSLFERYILSLYKRFNLKFNSQDIGFEISDVKEHQKFTSVSCLVDAKKMANNIEIEKIPVEFKLIRSSEGKIQAVDLEISNVSMVIEYRKKFYQMILDEGEEIEWFLEKFEDKVIANEDAIKVISEYKS